MNADLLPLPRLSCTQRQQTSQDHLRGRGKADAIRRRTSSDETNVSPDRSWLQLALAGGLVGSSEAARTDHRDSPALYGMDVGVEMTLLRREDVTRCILFARQRGSRLELPVWMLDRAVCAKMLLEARPRVDGQVYRAMHQLIATATNELDHRPEFAEHYLDSGQ